MPKEEIYCGLDIGSGRITGVLGRYDIDRDVVEILAGKQVIDREAISNGAIKDIDRSASLISDIINSLEEMAQVEKTKLIVGIRGPFVGTYDTTAQIPITSTDRTITKEDRDKVMDHAVKNLRITNERKIMSVIPQEFIIDGQAGITNPINMEGNVLEVKAHVVVAYSSFIRNIERTFNEAGYMVDELLYGLIPLSQLVTDNEERKLGCIVMDFSGQNIGVVTYNGGCIRYSKEFYSSDFDLGADLITREIAAYYKTSWNIAENIKSQYGVSFPSAIKKDESVEIPTRDGKSVRMTTKKEIAKIIAEVIENIFLDRVILELKKVPWVETTLQDGAIVLTGGGANLCGITEAVKELFRSEYGEIEESIEVRPGNIGSESGIVGEEDILSNFSYTTAISLIKYVMNNQEESFRKKEKEENFLSKFFKKIWGIFD
ncbi:MAG: cell division protein FtsA [Endomicrobia bacterium]|nr:cell division protein FtsA [Endomicrobiia bacterium]